MSRRSDIAAALGGLIATAPFIAVAWILVRRESPGPALFAQARVGRDRQVVTCYKLRTMYVGTANRPTHQTGPSAVTPLGAKLRRLKIDELPQLYNVLKGDMSLVGPRPCLPSQSELIEARDACGVLPGITGLAQAQGIDMSNPERLAEVDAAYVASRSFNGDIRLLIATVRGGGMNVDRVKGKN